MSRLDHTALIQAAEQLEPLPMTVARVVGVLVADNINWDDVVAAVSYDQILVARILRLANSAAFSHYGSTAVVRDAVIRLGAGHVLRLAVASGAQRRLQAALPQYGLAGGELWRHSVASALSVELLPQIRRAPVPVESFAAALLHDIGKLIMARFLDAERLQFLEQARIRGGLKSTEAETEILGLNHAEIGALVARRWNFPDRLARGIQYHDSPDQGGDDICDVLHVANIAAMRAGTGGSATAADLQADPGALDRMNVSLEGLDALTTRVADRLLDVVAQYGS